MQTASIFQHPLNVQIFLFFALHSHSHFFIIFCTLFLFKYEETFVAKHFRNQKLLNNLFRVNERETFAWGFFIACWSTFCFFASVYINLHKLKKYHIFYEIGSQKFLLYWLNGLDCLFIVVLFYDRRFVLFVHAFDRFIDVSLKIHIARFDREFQVCDLICSKMFQIIILSIWYLFLIFDYLGTHLPWKMALK